MEETTRIMVDGKIRGEEARDSQWFMSPEAHDTIEGYVRGKAGTWGASPESPTGRRIVRVIVGAGCVNIVTAPVIV